MTKKRALILLGGMWHDFDGFAHSMLALLEAAGWQAQSSYDLELLTRLDEQVCDLVINYTCFAKHAEGLEYTGPSSGLRRERSPVPAVLAQADERSGQAPEKMSDSQIEGLTHWVRAGGAFLSAHAASVRGESGPGLSELTGGFFVEHPPAYEFTVYPVYRPHPITDGIEAFPVYDEMYIEQCDSSVDVHMLAVERGVAYPLVWSKPEGRGRVAHVALGHSAAVWELEPYRRLMLQTIGWLTD